MTKEEIARIRTESETVIRKLGGEVCEWLPWLDRATLRPSSEVADRALILNAVIQIHFGAPAAVVAAWIDENGLTHGLSERERSILAESEDELDAQDITDLYWCIEALWALVWCGSLIEDLPVDQAVASSLASLVPNLQANEPAEAFRARFSLRPFGEIYRMLDLYYRAHWYAREGQLRRFETGKFVLDVIMERRKALEWVSDATIEDWDDTPQDT
jgi:uncharacterized protein DUF4272